MSTQSEYIFHSKHPSGKKKKNFKLKRREDFKLKLNKEEIWKHITNNEKKLKQGGEVEP